VFAAASLKTALDPIAADWGAETGHVVTISYGSTATLATQIKAGAPADMFIAASEAWMDDVVAAGAMAADSRIDLLGNTLVLVGAQGAAAVDLATLPQRLGDGKLSMAFVETVPAGQYGKAALERLGLWATVEAQVVQSDNVRTALAFVARGEAAFGVVYQSDAVAETGVGVVATFPAGSYPDIVFPVALTAQASDAAAAFLVALQAPAADAVFLANGFTLQ
jgi:molybdate transport system substrate-binding protein